MNFRLPCAAALLLFSSAALAEAPSRDQLAALEKDPAAASAKELVAKARAAYVRADRLRGVGDAVRAKLVESTGDTWTQAAVALHALAASRTSVEATEQKAHAAEDNVSRARAALEASFAREQSLVQEANKPRGKTSAAEVKTAAAPAGGAAPKAPKPAAKKAPATGGMP